MSAETQSAGDIPVLKPQAPPASALSAPITTALISWVVISVGFFGLKVLMEERPEFVGQPLRVTKAELVQESPRIVIRKLSDDVSVIRPAQPEAADVRFDMHGRRDYRGLRTIRDMSGEFRATYVLTNASEEASFVLFKCPHPRTENGDNQGLLASELKLQASAKGLQETTTNAWFWSGTIEPHGSANLEVSYSVASLKAVAYRVIPYDGNQVKYLRVTFRRQDLGSLRFESGDGTKPPLDDTVVWERKNFLAPDFFSAEIEEGRNLYASLTQLLEIGPVICLLFLLSISAVILARQQMTALQMLTIAVGYAFYFPLILYLSAKFSFVWALILAVIVPGALLVNYARWLVGPRLGLIGGAVFLVLYQVFPTIAAFAGWHRGMVLLCLGVVTLGVLINLQNQALRQKARVAVALLLACGFSGQALGAEVQVILPAELTNKLPDAKRESMAPTNAVIGFEPAQYQVRQEAAFFQVEARMAFQVIRAGEVPWPMFAVPVYLQESKFEPAEPDVAHLVVVSNRLSIAALQAGKGTVRLLYRAPIEFREGKRRAQIPVALGPSGNMRIEAKESNLEILNGSVWLHHIAEKTNSYEVGVAGQESLLIEWREGGAAPPVVSEKQAEGTKVFYGIGLTRAQNLSIINSDGSCTHFAEFELPVSQSEEFRLKLPARARLVSVSVNGSEISAPILDEQVCRVRLPARDPQQSAHRISFRMAYPPMRLGFVGLADMALPELFQTAGRLEWVIALPNGFDAQVIASGLETQKTTADLTQFGDYGRVLKSHPQVYLAKDLAPPGLVNLSLKYRQSVSGLYEARAD
jgi:hypothetical protein